MEDKVMEDGTLGSLEMMPMEVVLYVMEFVDPLSWPVCRFVSRRFNELVKYVVAHRHCYDVEEEPVRPAPPLRYLNSNYNDGHYDQRHLLVMVEGECAYFKSIIAPEDFPDRLARQGRLTVLQWARTNGCPITPTSAAAAAGGGHLDVLMWLIGEGGCEGWNGARIIARAAFGGHVELIKWAREQGCPWDESSCSEASRGGHLELLKWLRDSGCQWDERTCVEAVKAGHINILHWAVSNGCPCGEYTIPAAAHRGDRDTLMWLTSHGCWGSSIYNWEVAAVSSGNLDLCKWITGGRRAGFTNRVVSIAAATGKLDLVEWALEPYLNDRGTPPYTACLVAAYKGNLAMLQWLPMWWNNGRRGVSRTEAKEDSDELLVSPLVCDAAAAGGHMEVLKWLVARGCWWDRVTCAFAAVRGHHELLHWLQEDPGLSTTNNLCKLSRGWDTRLVFDTAYDSHIETSLKIVERSSAERGMASWWEGLMIGGVDNNQLALLEWAQASGFSTEMATTVMAYRGKLDMLKWARAKGFAWSARTCIVAIYGGHLNVVEWLRANGCRWDERSCEAAALTGQLEVLQWLRSRGCPWGVKTFALAARGGHVDVVKWLHSHGCPWSRSKALKEAIKEGHSEMVQWIFNNQTCN